MILALLAALQAPTPGDTLPTWRAELAHTVDHHARDRSDWQLTRALVGHRSGTTVVQADLWRARRFDVTDDGGGIEAYLRPHHLVGVYLRGELAPDAEVMSRGGATVGVTRGWRGGWETGVQYRRMEYADDGFDIYGGGIGRYQGSWYLRLNGSLVPHDGRTGGTVGAALRRYGRGGDLDEFVELRADGGKEIVTLGSGLPPELRSTFSAALWGQRSIGAGWGVRGTAGWTSEAKAPSRVTVGVGVVHRW